MHYSKEACAGSFVYVTYLFTTEVRSYFLGVLKVINKLLHT